VASRARFHGLGTLEGTKMTTLPSFPVCDWKGPGEVISERQYEFDRCPKCGAPLCEHGNPVYEDDEGAA
jgi:hypothetical protein